MINSKSLKIVFLILIILFFTFSLTGCWDRRELDNLAVVAGIGIDLDEETGNVRLTAQIVKAVEVGSPQSSGGDRSEDGEKAGAVWVVESTGKTVFEAVRAFTFQSSRKLYFPHNKIIVIGKELAKKGVRPYLNFFIRDHQTRNTVYLAVAEGKAAEVMKVKTELEKIPAFGIARLIESRAVTSQSVEVSLHEFLSLMLSKSSATAASYICLNQEEQEKKVFIRATSIFKGDKFVGIFNKKESRGLLWVLNKVDSGIIVVNGPGGKEVSLEIMKSSSKIKPKFDKGKLIIQVQISEEANLGENFGGINLVTTKMITFLEKQQNKAIEDEIKAALEKAYQYKADVFGFGNAVYRIYPEEWKQLETNWEQIFPGVKVEIKVKTKIREVGMNIKPPVPGKM